MHKSDQVHKSVLLRSTAARFRTPANTVLAARQATPQLQDSVVCLLAILASRHSSN